MARESSGPGVVAPPGKTAAVQDIAGGFIPTEGQRLAKARIWAAVRSDPLLRPERTGAAELASIARMPSVEKWCADPKFKSWLCAGNEVAETTEFLMSNFLHILGSRMVGMTDKDLIQAGKLLAELQSQQKVEALQSQSGVELLSDEKLKQLAEGK